MSIHNNSVGCPIAGENYTLEYFVNGTTNPVSFQWWKDQMIIVSNTSQLQFAPLNQQSDNGSYCCNATVGEVMHSSCFEVTVNGMTIVNKCFLLNSKLYSFSAPSIEMNISGRGNLIIGENYTLLSNVDGIQNLDAVIAHYHWTKPDSSNIRIGSSTLILPSLRLSDAGLYTCEINITSTYLHGNFMIVGTHPVNIQSKIFCYFIYCTYYSFSTVPAPLSIIVSAKNTSLSNTQYHPIGSNITLMCLIKFGPAVMEPDLSLLMVRTQLSRDGTTLDLTGPVVSDTTFTYTIQLNSFGRNDSGNYSCTATISSGKTPHLVGNKTVTDYLKISTGCIIYIYAYLR